KPHFVRPAGRNRLEVVDRTLVLVGRAGPVSAEPVKGSGSICSKCGNYPTTRPLDRSSG
uniref:Uncharacterized protein n=1 Tax=Ciona intestinalis TaxID=7719 RepID=H2XJU1_CIOIN